MTSTTPRRVAVVGLGYVGLPLAAAFGQKLPTIGFDVNAERADELRRGVDRNGETGAAALAAPHLTFTSDPTDLAAADVLIIAVPTPVDRVKRPDHSYLASASHLVGEALARRKKLDPDAAPAIVVYESTVYPGCTEEICVPLVERSSGLKGGHDFKVGYSPERINPGDTLHTLEKITKVVSGQDAATLDVIARLYEQVVTAGVYRAPDIRTAEAAKVIENTQRDLNIALMNELSILFHRLGIDTQEVLKAAGTKWNFLPFKPGLVGGHCIPEDPYYLTYKAEQVGYHPNVILAGRRINDGMGQWVAQESVKLLIKRGHKVQGARALILGVTFKEDVKDTRNTRVLDIVRELGTYGVHVVVHDPLVDASAIKGLGAEAAPENVLVAGGATFDLVVLAVPHLAYRELALERYLELVGPASAPGVLVDVKGVLARDAVEASGTAYWRL